MSEPLAVSERDEDGEAARAERMRRIRALQEKYRDAKPGERENDSLRRNTPSSETAAVVAGRKRRRIGSAASAAATAAVATAASASGSAQNQQQKEEEAAEDDIFAGLESGEDKVAPAALALGQPAVAADGQNDDDWNDAHGYYIIRAGEVVNERYEVIGQRGRGVFSNVAFARRTESDGQVAIKVLRRNETMRRAGSQEESLLQEVLNAPAASRRHIVEFIESFYHRQHLCLVFEAMKMNLRQVLYRFGRNIGINIEGVRRYGRHMLLALKCLKELDIVHADVKLDNILVSGDLQEAKLCDFGCAFRNSDPRNEDTTYLVSRFYRAPEVILGLPREMVGPEIDLWALATCLFELYAGKVLFPGRTNNEMLGLMMQAKGRIPNRIVKRHLAGAQRKEPHFDPGSLAFRQVLADDAAGQPRLKVAQVPTVPEREHSIVGLLEGCKAAKQDRAQIAHLARLIDQALALDPAARPSLDSALASPFFAPAVASPSAAAPAAAPSRPAASN